MFKNPIPDFSSLKVEPTNNGKSIGTNSVMHDINQNFVKFECMIDAICLSLPLSKQEAIRQDFLRLLASKNLRLVEP